MQQEASSDERDISLLPTVLWESWGLKKMKKMKYGINSSFFFHDMKKNDDCFRVQASYMEKKHDRTNENL